MQLGSDLKLSGYEV